MLEQSPSGCVCWFVCEQLLGWAEEAKGSHRASQSRPKFPSAAAAESPGCHYTAGRLLLLTTSLTLPTDAPNCSCKVVGGGVNRFRSCTVNNLKQEEAIVHKRAVQNILGVAGPLASMLLTVSGVHEHSRRSYIIKQVRRYAVVVV